MAAKENSRGALFAAKKLKFAGHMDLALSKIVYTSALTGICCSAHQKCLRREGCLPEIGASPH